MAKTPAVSARSSERVKIAKVDQWYRTVRTAVRVIGVVAAVWLLRGALDTLAGETTRLAFELSVLADVKFAVSVALAGSAAVWAIAERMLRHRKVESLQDRIKELERRLDPGRTSSQLTPKGKTNPYDKET